MPAILSLILLATLMALDVPPGGELAPPADKQLAELPHSGVGVISQVMDAFNRGADQQALMLFAEDVELLIVGNGSNQPRGRDGLAQALQRGRRVSPAVELRVLKIFKIDQLHIVQYQLRGSAENDADDAPGAAAITAGCLAFINIEDGLITRWENYHNPLAFIQPAPGIRAGATLAPGSMGPEVIAEGGAPGNGDVIERYYQAVNLNSDLVRASFFDPDAQLRIQANGFLARGVDQIKARWSSERDVFPRRMELPARIDLAGDYAIVRSSVTAVYEGREGVAGTQGKEIIFHPAAIYRLNQGRINSIDYFYNEYEFLVQLGTTVP